MILIRAGPRLRGRMSESGVSEGLSLICEVGTRLCALPLQHVIETMRPLPVEPFVGAPPFISGVSIVRGEVTPVVDVGKILAPEDESKTTRFITLRVDGRQVALAVDSVLGIRSIPRASLRDAASLLGTAGAEVVAAVGTLNAELLLVLRSACLVPATTWMLIENEVVLT